MAVQAEEEDLSLKAICDELGEVSFKWSEIGVQLGVPHHVLKKFEDERNPLSAVIDYWRRGNTKIPRTWESIVAALKSKYVGEPQLAKKISESRCQRPTEPGR